MLQLNLNFFVKLVHYYVARGLNIYKLSHGICTAFIYLLCRERPSHGASFLVLSGKKK